MSGFKPAGRHQEKRLTAATIRNLGPGLHGDGQGLYLKVDGSGSKRWIQRIVIQGKRRDLGLGSYSLITLAEARERAIEQRKEARLGGDPLAAKRRSMGVPTFEEAARLVHAHNEGSWRNDKHKKQWLSSLENYAFKCIGAKKIDKIDSADITNMLDPFWLNRAETARRIKQRVGIVFKWSIARGYRTDNPAAFVQQALAKHDRSLVKHMKALPYREVASALEKISASKALEASKLALHLLVHTATRSGEVRGARWSEVDYKAGVWTIPAERMKAKKEHRVPLSTDALSILKQAEKLRRNDTDLIFLGATGKPLSDMTLSKLVKELGIAAVPHGFRSSFRVWAGEATTHAHQVIEFALAHVIKNKAEAAYARSDLLDKRKILMADWSAFLTNSSAPQ